LTCDGSCRSYIDPCDDIQLGYRCSATSVTEYLFQAASDCLEISSLTFQIDVPGCFQGDGSASWSYRLAGSDVPLGAIIGGVIGGIVLIAVGVLLFILIRRRHSTLETASNAGMVQATPYSSPAANPGQEMTSFAPEQVHPNPHFGQEVEL
jgi:hypothetical protein